MVNSISRKAYKIWSEVTEMKVKPKGFNSETELRKAMVNFFHVGDYYCYIFNVSEMRFDYLSREVGTILGYEVGEITVPLFLSLIHPEDQPYFLNFENERVNFLKKVVPSEIKNYKSRYDYRVKTKSGKYIRILQQVIVIDHKKDGSLIRTFGVHTDISYLKPEGVPIFSIIGLNGAPSYHNINAKKIFVCNEIKLTKREKEVLELMIQGYKSKEIAEKLFIGKQTVDTHRKNLLQKTGVKNTPAMITFLLKQGII